MPNLATSSSSKAAMESVITDGISGTKMKAYGDKLSAQEIDDLVAWIRAL